MSRAARGAVVIAVAALVSACSSQVAGTPRVHIAPGTVQASFLGMDEVSTALGFTLTTGDSAGEPPPALGADPASCAAAVGPSTQAVYASGWTGFWSETFSDVSGDHTVTQVLGAYPDAGRAAKVLGALTDGVKGCASAVRTDDDQGTSKWAYTVGTASTGALAWTATQEDAKGWSCARQGRLKNKTVLQVAVCEAGDGKQAAAAIADRFASRIGG